MSTHESGSETGRAPSDESPEVRVAMLVERAVAGELQAVEPVRPGGGGGEYVVFWTADHQRAGTHLACLSSTAGGGFLMIGHYFDGPKASQDARCDFDQRIAEERRRHLRRESPVAEVLADQHGFSLAIEIVERGSYGEAFAEALAVADEIWDRLDAAEVVVRPTGASLFRGVPNGVYCGGCEGSVIPGVHWSESVNGDGSHGWVERCKTCSRYDSDAAAAKRVREEYEDAGCCVEHGTATPRGLVRPRQFVDIRP